MKKCTPLLVLATFGMLLSGCGEDTPNKPSTGPLTISTDFKTKHVDLLKYNAKEFDFKETKYSGKMLEDIKLEYAREYNFYTGPTIKGYVDTKEGSPTIDKVALYNKATGKQIVPFSLKDGSIRSNNTSTASGICFVDGIIESDTGNKKVLYDDQGNLIAEIDMKDKTFANFMFLDELEIKVTDETKKVFEYKISLYLDGDKEPKIEYFHYVNGKFIKGKYDRKDETLKVGDDTTKLYDLKYLNLPGYKAKTDGETFTVYDKDNKLVSSSIHPSMIIGNNGAIFGLNKQIYYQYIRQLPDNERNYDFIHYYTDENDNIIPTKYKLNTERYDILTGIKEQIKFDFIIERVGNDGKSFKGEDGSYIYTALSGRKIKKDKTLDTLKHYVFDKDFNIAFESNEQIDNDYIKFGENYCNYHSGLTIDENGTVLLDFRNSNIYDSYDVMPIFKAGTFLAFNNREENMLLIDATGKILKKYDFNIIVDYDPRIDGAYQYEHALFFKETIADDRTVSIDYYLLNLKTGNIVKEFKDCYSVGENETVYSKDKKFRTYFIQNETEAYFASLNGDVNKVDAPFHGDAIVNGDFQNSDDSIICSFDLGAYGDAYYIFELAK